MMSCSFKVGIVGAGHVGVTSAYALIIEGTATEIVLVSRDKNKAYGEKLDLDHSLPFLSHTNILATDDYQALSGSQLVFVTAGVAQTVGETRLDLVQKNLAIMEDIIPKIVANAPNAVIVLVANPVDILTYRAHQLGQLPFGQIFGTGTMLDTARFRFHLSQQFGVNSRSIHTYILGEHGDSSFPALSSASIGGQPLASFPNYSKEIAYSAFDQAKTAAYQIIAAKGATYYAIATVMLRLTQIVFKDAKTVLPASIPLTDYYGVSGVSLSVPCVIGARGVEKVLNVELDEEEQNQLRHSADVIRQVMQ